MPLPDLLNLAIGLIVLYFLLSTICSIVVELFARFIRYREELLTITINSLITGKKDKPWNVLSLTVDRVKNEIINLFTEGSQADPDLLLPGKKKKEESKDEKPDLSPTEKFASKFWGHPEIKPLASNYQEAPAAIPSETFARAIVDIALPRDLQEKLPKSKVSFLQRLKSNKDELPEPIFYMLQKACSSSDIPENAVGNVFWNPLYNRIEKRYEDNMATTSDRFKGWTQKWLLIIGFTVACFLNADSIQFIRLLSINDEARSAIATYSQENIVLNEKSAKDSESETPKTDAEQKEEIKDSLKQLKELSSIGFPIGWRESESNLYPFISDPLLPREGNWFQLKILPYLLKLIGLLTTALAINMGAPFWYGLLSKLIGARQKAGLATPPGEATRPTDIKVAQVLESQNPTPLEISHDLASPNNGFDARKAYWLAEASHLAYQNEEQIINKVTKDWFLPKPLFWSKSGKAIDTQAFAVTIDDNVLVAFRGTEPTKINDLGSDANISWTELSSENASSQIELHTGFLNALNAVYSDICDFLESKEAASAKQVYITGHSLGGALSLALATKLALDEKPASKKAIIYNFGCPRIGNVKFAQYFDRAYAERVIRVVNEDDIVTKIPTMGLQFRHVGTMLHLQANGKFAFDVPSVERFLNLVIAATDDAVKATKKSLADHSMETYRKRCQDLTGAQVG